MADISVNEYIRTKSGCIEKVTQDLFDELYIDEEGEIEIVVGCDIEGTSVYDMITKHSFNLIDLIELCDYVNGVDINFIDRDQRRVCHDAHSMLDACSFSNDEIQTIVTHEQFKSMEYKVRDDEQ